MLTFEMKFPAEKPLPFESLTKEQFDIEIQKGYESILKGRTHSADAVEEEMSKEFNL